MWVWMGVAAACDTSDEVVVNGRDYCIYIKEKIYCCFGGFIVGFNCVCLIQQTNS